MAGFEHHSGKIVTPVITVSEKGIFKLEYPEAFPFRDRVIIFKLIEIVVIFIYFIFGFSGFLWILPSEVICT